MIDRLCDVADKVDLVTRPVPGVGSQPGGAPIVHPRTLGGANVRYRGTGYEESINKHNFILYVAVNLCCHGRRYHAARQHIQRLGRENTHDETVMAKPE